MLALACVLRIICELKNIYTGVHFFKSSLCIEIVIVGRVGISCFNYYFLLHECTSPLYILKFSITQPGKYLFF